MEECTSSSHEPIQAVLKLKFSKLKLHGEPVASHDALTNDDIQDIFSVLDIFRDEDYCPPISSCKDGKHLPEKLNQFIENRCRARYFSYQIRNVFFLICFQSYREIKISGFECMLFTKDFSSFHVWKLLVLRFKPPKTATWATTLAYRPNTKYYSTCLY